MNSQSHNSKPDGQPHVQPDIQPEIQPAPIAPVSSPRLPGWRLWLPLVFQAFLILAVPARDAYTYVAGQPVTLQTAPVDPYDLLRGYYQTLGYTISNPETLRALPGGSLITTLQGKPTRFYVVLEDPQTATVPPQPWKPVRVSADRPADLPENQVAIEGQWDGWTVTYGLETYYMPEDQREQINAEVNEARSQPETFVVDVKVDASGNAVPVSLWIRDQRYRF